VSPARSNAVAPPLVARLSRIWWGVTGCLLGVALAPWNRRAALSWRMLAWTLFSAPEPGNLLERQAARFGSGNLRSHAPGGTR